MENKQKRFYKVGEQVWLFKEKQKATVKSIDKEKVEITLEMADGQSKTVKLWDIDKLKYKAAEKKNESDLERLTRMIALIGQIYNPEVFFAKVTENAIIPSKRKEDAGYDVYADLTKYARIIEGEVVMEIECPVFATTLVPTGLAVAMPDTHYLNLKHERGSTGVQSMAVLAGVIDSGFRNEMFVAMTPLRKSVIITNQVQKVEENATHILYPLSKAIVQGTIDLVPDATIKEISLAELQAMPSQRGMTMLGQSGK